MCGLTGFVGTGGRMDLEAMADAIAHRGPDDAGFHIEDEHALYLGFRRLAVVDIAGGHQPMWNEDKSVCVLFNGEIYNQAELRAELVAAGHIFRSDHSDTEVLAHGYEEWGEDLPARLNGMFAFVVWDRPRRRLFAARDRFGEKPFYYAARPGFFAFASELSALIRHPAVDRTIDQRALQKFFAYGYIPAPNALYRGARKLPGGCSLTFDLPARTALLAFRHRNRRGRSRNTDSRADRGAARPARSRRGSSPGQRCPARHLSFRRDRFLNRSGLGGAPPPARRARHVHDRIQ
jgi:asparagine synthase (glutamine-hydrolysing)